MTEQMRIIEIPEFVNAGYWFSSTNDILPVENIDAKFFTHIFAGFAAVDSRTYEVTIDEIIARFPQCVKRSNDKVKALLSIAGFSERFAKLAGDDTYRSTFISSSIRVARECGFDGLDLQWLYPSSHDEMNDFENLLDSWYDAIMEEAHNYSKKPLLLVATVSNLPYLPHNLEYPKGAIIRNLNWVNILSYDFYTPSSSSKATGPSSALNNPNAKSLSTIYGIQLWNELLNVTSSTHKRIVFGIPFHGWAWKLANSHQHNLFSKADGAAKGEYIAPDGQIYYSNIKKFIDDNQAEHVKKDPMYDISYAYSGTTWIAYESERTIEEKVSAAKKENVLGYFAYNIAADDVTSKSLTNAALMHWGN